MDTRYSEREFLADAESHLEKKSVTVSEWDVYHIWISYSYMAYIYCTWLVAQW